MKHYNIPIFIPHNGCPHQCSFCNQKQITGQAYQPDENDVTKTIENAINNLGKNTNNAEIAFFGGSFTAIDREYMTKLLNATRNYIHKFSGIRISTRPDYIDDDVLNILKEYNVTTIELGAQSMSDTVLMANNRGHSSDDVVNASKLIKSKGFNLGLQMMTGLYKATPELDLLTAEKFISLKPQCVRIYPTVIVKNTDLENLYKTGEYVPNTLNESVDLCAKLVMMFYNNNIDVIRLGLHYSDSLVNGSMADNYHPAFKELCESKILFDKFISLADKLSAKNLIVSVSPKSVSKFIGQNRSNIIKLNDLGYCVSIKRDSSLDKYDILVKEKS